MSGSASVVSRLNRAAMARLAQSRGAAIGNSPQFQLRVRAAWRSGLLKRSGFAYVLVRG
jgi:hypothetical protein